MLQRAVTHPRLIMFITFGATSVINYIFSLATARILLPGDFGLLAFAQTLLLITSLILGSGITTSLTTAIVGVTNARRATLIRGVLALNLGFALLIGAAIALLFALGPLHQGLETINVTAILALTLLFISLIATSAAALQGAEQFGMLAAVQGVEIVCKAVAGIALTLLGLGAAGALAGFLIGAVVAAALGLYFVARELDVRLWGAVDLPSRKVVGPMFGALLGLALLQNLDLASVKLFSGAAGIERTLTGYYQAATILANTPYYLVSAAIAPILMPQLARFDTLGATRRNVAEALRLVVIVVIPIEGVLVIAPHMALNLLLPAKYAPAAPTLRVLAIGNSSLMALAILAVGFQATGYARVPARILLSVTLGEALILYAVVPHWQAGGAATVFVTASTLSLVCLGVAYVRALGAHWARRTASWLARYAAAGAAGTLLGVAFSAIVGNVAVAVGVGYLGYLATLLPLRLVERPRTPTGVARWVQSQSIAAGREGRLAEPDGTPSHKP